MSIKSLPVMAFIMFISLSQNTFATPNENLFEKETKAFYLACKSSPCIAPYASDLVYSHKSAKNQKLSKELYSELSKVAIDQAGVWGDTILEGDYEAEGHTRLDSVEVMYKDGQAFGYKITYSEKGWYIGECSYDGEHKDTLKECATGRIVESSYVTLDFKDYFFDENSFADFHVGEN